MHSKLNILWIDAISCNGCSHSFFNYPYFSSFFNDFNFLYHPLFDSDEFKIRSCDVLIIEGAIKDDFLRLGNDLTKLISLLIKKAKKVIALGSCASFGGMFGEGILYNKEEKGRFFEYKDKVINIPGCPIHYEWLVEILYMIKNKKEILLDELNRPKEIFSYTSHMGCVRNEYFEWKIDAENFGEKEGCLFYYQGCQGPFTHSNCNKILWNEVNSKPRAGTPCFGCTEPNFPKENLFKTETLMGIPDKIPLGVSKRAYLTISGIAKSLKNERLSKKLIECKNENR